MQSKSLDGPKGSFKIPLNNCWLVVLNILKKISQWEGLSHVLWKIKNVPNHQPDWIIIQIDPIFHPISGDIPCITEGYTR